METNRCVHCGCDNRLTNKYCSNCGHELPTVEVAEVKAEPQKKNKPNWKGLVLVSIVVAISTLSANFIPKLFKDNSNVDAILVQIASEMNKMLPMYIDSETVLDNVASMPNNTLQYNYSLVNVEGEQIDTIQIKSVMEPNIVNLVKTSPEMQTLRDNNVDFKYYYKDKTGKYLFSILIPHQKYKENN